MPAEVRKLFNGLFLVDKDSLVETFAEIKKLYRSLGGFLAQCCCLDESKLAALQAKYLRKE
ncbi:MAG: hypothetical protein J6038_00190 [Bacilli bacterium]|nr:hypothetical protein [Bacilli bacterium]